MLEKVTKLSMLDLRDNQVEDVGPLAKQTELKLLMIERNKIKDLKPLVDAAKADAAGPKLFAPYLRLYLAGNPLSERAKAKQLEALRPPGSASRGDSRTRPGRPDAGWPGSRSEITVSGRDDGARPEPTEGPMFELIDAFRDLDPHRAFILAVALLIAFGFEVVNGFHDTANAVTTVIYTRTLRPTPAVLFSGLCNFLGVLLGGTAIAFSIVHLLPVDLLIDATSKSAIVMVLALLTVGDGLEPLDLVAGAAGLQLAHPDRRHPGRRHGQQPPERPGPGRRRELGEGRRGRPRPPDLAADRLRLGGDPPADGQAIDPRPGALRPPARRPEAAPPGGSARSSSPPAAGSAWRHGSNDGQKGMGLIMLVLIGLLPASYALNLKDERRGPRRRGPPPRASGLKLTSYETPDAHQAVARARCPDRPARRQGLAPRGAADGTMAASARRSSTSTGCSAVKSADAARDPISKTWSIRAACSAAPSSTSRPGWWSAWRSAWGSAPRSATSGS